LFNIPHIHFLKKPHKISRFTFVLLTIFSISGCDLNDDSDSNETNSRSGTVEYPETTGLSTPANTGVFSAIGLVQGLEYRTASISGVTDEHGVFYYRAGEDIEFSIGGTILGETKAQASLTPTALVDGVKLPTTQDEAKGYVNTYLFTSAGYINDATRKLDQVVNISSFMMSLDQDKDSDNGLQIHAGSLIELKSVAFDLTMLGRDFEKNTYYSSVLHQLYNKQYIKNAIAVKSLLALDAFTQSQLMPSPLFILAEHKSAVDTLDLQLQWKYLLDSQGYVTSTTYWQDGNVDRQGSYRYSNNGDFTLINENIGAYNESVKSYQYNQHGKRTVREEYALSGFKYGAQYDANGNFITFTQDNDRDGSVDRVNHMSYDDRGNLLLETRDYENDGVINDRLHYEYDDLNREISLIRDNGENTIYRHEQRWDDNGRLVYFAEFSGLSETPEKEMEIVVSADGEVYTLQYDYDNDGQFEDVRQRISNSDGQILRETYDREGDGIFESVDEWELDLNGNVVVRTYSSHGENYSQDYIHYYEYDEFNNPISYRFDWDHDGEIDNIIEKSYNQAGFITQVKKTDVEDAITEVTNYQRNSENLLTYWEEKLEGQELALEFSRFEYDTYGEQVLLERDTDGDGIVDNVTEYDRSGTGFYLKKLDQNGNGFFESVSHIDQHGNSFKTQIYNDSSHVLDRHYESDYKQMGYMPYYLFDRKRTY